ncbi:hypothetical protein [Paenibacillus lautus]|uniref:Uncharacterized protein n=1 Tax=Paenibacillus lautus TaxID=1401 RepID=A0A385TUT2_PAELA|nr:hypothetical protein [Paenibacillus lautus]AYB46252.1 hypothetical protein D5F53_24450 [Paenibacillus lautus]
MKTKKFSLTLALTFGLVYLLLPLSTINASNDQLSAIEPKNEIKVNNFSVFKYQDGRIQGIDAPEKLTDPQKTNILKLMNFNEQEIEKMDTQFKDLLLKDGGIKVDTVTTDKVHIYTDLNGKDHIVTDKNREEINKLRQEELKKSNGEVSPLGVNDGIYSGYGTSVYKGKTSNGVEYIYTYHNRFYFNERPNYTYVDTIGHSWQTNATPKNSTGEYYVQNLALRSDFGFKSIDQSSLTGTKAEVDLRALTGQHIGTLTTEVRIPVSDQGKTAAFASAYAHAHTNNLINMALGVAGITFGSQPGDKWGWRDSFKIGPPAP